MEEILTRAKKVAEEAEVFMVSSEATPVHFEANRLKHIQSKQSNSVALRIIKDGKTGYATSTRLDGEDLVNNAVATAEFGTEAKFEFPPLTPYPKIEVFDPDVEAVSLEEMAKLGEELVSAVTNHTAGILCDASVTRTVSTIRIINSRGGQASYQRSIFSLGIEGQLIQDTDMLFVFEGQSSCHPLLDTKSITGIVLHQLELAKTNATIRTGSLPVIFTPEGLTSTLIMPMITAFNGKSVLEGASPIGSKSGQQVYDSKLSLLDDPTTAYRPDSGPCDDEGIPNQRTPLITEGVVSNFLYDLQTAAMAGTTSTGNGHRGGGLPSPSSSTIIIIPGNTTFSEMVQDIKEGLVVETVMGATQGNVLGGDFSGNVLLGFKIENGEIVGRVKNTMVSGNIYQLLYEIVAIGSDTKWVGGSLSTPSIYCPSVSVASK